MFYNWGMTLPHMFPDPSICVSPPHPSLNIRSVPNASTLHQRSRRGAQPGNRNAYKHGFYSRQVTRLYPSSQEPLSASGSFEQVLSDRLDRLSWDIRLEMCRLFAASTQTRDLDSLLPYSRAIARHMSRFISVKNRKARLDHTLRQLRLVAERTLDLIRYDFLSRNIPTTPDSFLGNLKKPDQNPKSSSFLTPHQHRLIEPFLFPLIVSHPGPGAPLADPHPLIDAVFWKLAFRARWDDFPVDFPSAITVQRFFRRLSRSGLLYPIYKALYRDLLARGGVSLPDLVARGCFHISGNAIVPDPSLPETWQVRTALLLMQLAFQSSRRIIRRTAGKPVHLQNFVPKTAEPDSASLVDPLSMSIPPHHPPRITSNGLRISQPSSKITDRKLTLPTPIGLSTPDPQSTITNPKSSSPVPSRPSRFNLQSKISNHKSPTPHPALYSPLSALFKPPP
jgi:transposase